MNPRGLPPSPFFRTPGTAQKVKKGVSGLFHAGNDDDFVNDFNCGQGRSGCGQGEIRLPWTLYENDIHYLQRWSGWSG